MNFHFQAKEGQIHFPSEYSRNAFKKHLELNEGAIFDVVKRTPESSKQRKYFEGCVVPLVTYYQEGFDHRNNKDCERVRDWLKIEFNGEIVIVLGKTHKIAKSTKGELNKGFLERVMDWLVENYQPPLEVLLPEKYKDWRDRVYPFSNGANNYISYLIEIGVLSC